MILDAFLSNFSTLLAKMAEDEVGMLLGVPGEIEKLGRTVHDIQCVISDAEGKQTKSSAIKRWLLELEDVMYDADDLMDLCQIKAEDHRAHFSYLSTSKFSCGINLLSCFHPIFAHEMGKKIKHLNARLDEIAKRKSGLGLRLQDVVGQSSSFHRERSDISRKTDPSIVQDDIVGDKMVEDTQLLVKWLTTEDTRVKENVSVVGIVGMGGIGKTTLAKNVFNDPRIKEEFRLQFWVCVSKDLKEIELLKCIIREAGGYYGAAEERAELVPMLQELVRGKKFFLVLDDVWPQSQNVWDGLLRDPMIGGAHGSRLLITTRDEGVAHFMKATSTHRVDKLSDEEAWSLLIKQVSLDENESKNLKDIGLELVIKCAGLPLAVKAIGGVLRMRGKNRAEWQTILKSNLWSLIDLPGEFPHAFYLSYEDLPSNLKQCFIFCSFYLEDYEFAKSQLIYLWLAEGFLCDKRDLSFFEIGKENYKELISRNLLEASKGYYDQGICKMHDLLRSFAQNMGNGDSFIMREGKLSCKFESKSVLKLRRLSIERTMVDSDLEFLNKQKSLRTLLLINNSMGDVMSNVLSSFTRLRIIDLTLSKISSLPDSFCGLVHLRHLDAIGSKLETLPNSIGNLRKLEFLGLGICEWLSHVPSGIFNLLHLRFLSFVNTNIEAFPTGLRKLKKLVELHGFMPDKDNSKGLSSLEDLGTMSQLSELTLYNLEKASDVIVAKKANLEEKIHLKDLKFFYNSIQGCQVSLPNEEKKVIEDVLNALSPPPFIEILTIHGYFGRQLPKWLYVGIDPSKLKFLRFLKISQCEFFSQLLPLGLLPNLDLLRIEGAISVVKIGQEFLLDDRAEVNHSSILLFPQLNSLKIKGMSCWKEWLWEERQQAMPKLKELIIEECPKLSSLPEGLSHDATSLEYLKIDAADQITFVEEMKSLKDLCVFDNPNLKRISNLPNLSNINIRNCPNLVILENLNFFHRMELIDLEMETIPEYLKTIMPEKMTVWCRKELIMNIISLGIGSFEWQKFEHIPVVKINSIDESLSVVYQKTPFNFMTKPPMADPSVWDPRQVQG